MDFSTLFTEAKSGRIAEKIWNLPNDNFGDCKRIELDIAHYNTLDARGVKLLYIGLSELYSIRPSNWSRNGLEFTQEMINSLKNIEHINIQTKNSKLNLNYNLALIPVDYPEEIKEACKIIIEDMDRVIENSKKNGKLLDEFRNDFIAWLDDFVAS